MKQLIDCRYLHLTEFQIQKGYQPKNSLLFFTAGQMEYTINGATLQVGENTLVSFPDTLYFERKLLGPAEFYLVRYENPDNAPLPQGTVPIENTGRLQATLNYLVKLNFGNARLKNGFLADIFNQIEAESLLAHPQNDRVLAAVQDFFEKNLYRRITLSEAAAVAHLSPTGLISRYKKQTGGTPMEHLTALRLQKAEGLLLNSNDPITAIAFSCGFENPYYFSNTFKKHRGVSPTAYRKKYKP